VSATGRRERTAFFEVRTLASPVDHARIAVVVPRFQYSAVARNRAKRRLRELVRRELLSSLPPLDVVIRASRACYRADFPSLRTAMLDVAGRPSLRA
jgi:ribonuclease P protein component